MIGTLSSCMPARAAWIDRSFAAQTALIASAGAFADPLDGYSESSPELAVSGDVRSANLGGDIFSSRASDTAAYLAIADDDRTPPSSEGAPPSGAGAPPGGSGGGPADPKARVSAMSVFYALQSIRDRHNVFLDEPALAELMVDHGLIEWVTNEGRAAMKESLRDLEEFDEILRRVVRTIEDRKIERTKLKREVSSDACSILAVFSRRMKDRLRAKREQIEEIDEELEMLKRDRRSIEAKVRRKVILEEWLGRMARSDFHDAYATLTDRGLGVLNRMEGDRRLEYITFEDFMRLLEDELDS